MDVTGPHRVRDLDYGGMDAPSGHELPRVQFSDDIEDR